MNKIEEMIKQMCPEGVKRVKLGEVCDVYDGTHQTPKYADEGVKFVSVENINDIYKSDKYISIEDYNKKYKYKPCIGDVLMTRIGSIGKCAVVNKDESLAYYVSLSLLRPHKTELDSFFLSYIIESSVGKRELDKKTLHQACPIKINLSDIGKISIPLPPLPIQQEIVSILDSFTSLQSKLEEELASRQQQMEYYREKLLSFDKDDIRFVPEFCELKAGKAINASELTDEAVGSNIYPCYGGNGIRGYISKKSHSGDYAIIGRQGALCGCVNWAHGDFYATEHAVVVSPSSNVMSKYLYYLFVVADLNQYKSQGAQPGLSVTRLNELKFPIPPLSRQQEIVSTLDTMSSLIDKLKEEIELRKKQYEYYREALLSF